MNIKKQFDDNSNTQMTMTNNINLLTSTSIIMDYESIKTIIQTRTKEIENWGGDINHSRKHEIIKIYIKKKKSMQHKNNEVKISPFTYSLWT